MLPIQFIALPVVMKMTSLSRSSIYQIHDFPKPIKIRESSTGQAGARWIEAEIQAWMQGRISARGV